MRYTIVLISVVLALICRAFVISVYKVPTQSMAPTILAGDFVLASNTSYGLKLPWNEEAYFESEPKKGDLVVYSKDAKTYIKRVVAVAADEVELKGNQLYVNSLNCSYEDISYNEDKSLSVSIEKCADFSHTVLRSEDYRQALSFQKIKLAPKQFFVLSDNRLSDEKLILFDVISSDQIISKPMLIWMSYSTTQDFISQSLGFRWNRILTKPN